jgi:hypothetical protein
VEHFKAKSGEFKLPAPIGFIPLQEAVRIVGQKMGGDVDIERTIAEACEAGEIKAAYRSWTGGADKLDRRVWQMTHWRNYFATGTIDLYGLPLLDDNGHPVPDGRTVPVCTREIFIRKDDSLDRFIASIEPAAKPQQHARPGAPELYDWDDIAQFVRKEITNRGDFKKAENRIEGWRSQNDLLRLIENYLQRRNQPIPGPTRFKEKVGEILEQLRSELATDH